MSKLYYRVSNEQTQQGLWYDSKGNFTGLIHSEFNFCMNTNLQMPFDADLVGWLSATDSLEDLFKWFPKQDIEKLEKHGYFITVYESQKVKQYKNHLVICQETSKIKERICIGEIFNPKNKQVLGEVLTNMKPNVLIVGCGEAGLTASVIAQLKHDFGADIAILSPEQAIEKGLQRQPSFVREPIEIKAMPHLAEPFVDITNNQPWYTQLKKKRNKRK